MSDKDNDQAVQGGGHGEEAVYPYTPHHFHTAKQHFESGKMGLWLFLATEILFFAGLFCAYAIYRGLHPEVFYWSHFYLDTTMGAVNTVVLILSSFTAAWAVRCAQLGQKKMLRANIAATIVCACIFMSVKYVEYSHKIHDGLLPSGLFDPKHEVWETPSFKKQHPASAEAAQRITAGLAARKGKQAAVRDDIVGERAALLALPVANDSAETSVKAGVSPGSASAASAAPSPVPVASKPGSSSEGAAAGNGDGNKDAVLAELEEGSMLGLLKADAEGKLLPPVEKKVAAPVVVAEISDEAWLSRQIRALSEEERHPLERAGIIHASKGGPLSFERPANAGVFFSIYFFMTGLHGFHVLVGIGLWVWMLSIAKRRKLGRKYFGPIEFTALYWHLVDLIWIYLFPMLYLIH